MCRGGVTNWGQHFSIFFFFQFCFWMEFVPVSEVKVRRAVLIDEWLQVESYQKTLASHTPKPPRDDGGYSVV